MEEEKNRKKKVEVGVAITDPEAGVWRRRCGCLRTSEKLREILDTFPSAPPPTPLKCEGPCVLAYCQQFQHPQVFPPSLVKRREGAEPFGEPLSINEPVNSKSWQVAYELVELVQLSVTATALVLYYLIYCYMQLVYYTLRSALYFHQADGPMKVTIGVMTLTSLVVGFNLVIRIEKLMRII